MITESQGYNMQLLNQLAHPAREFPPIPFWFLNGDLTDKEIRRQLTDFAAHGVYGVVLHPRMGLAKRIWYLGRTYFHYIRAAVQIAAELGMTIVLCQPAGPPRRLCTPLPCV